MQLIHILVTVLVQLLGFYAYTKFPQQPARSSLQTYALKPGFKANAKVQAPKYGIDIRTIKDLCLVEYVSGKGSKRLAIVSKRRGYDLTILNSMSVEFSINVLKVSYLIAGNYAFSDLEDLMNLINKLQLSQVESLWESTIDQGNSVVDAALVSHRVFGSTSAIHLYASKCLMDLYGSVYFQKVRPSDSERTPNEGTTYVRLPLAVVKDNLDNQLAIEVFKSEYTRMVTQSAGIAGVKHNMSRSFLDVLNIYKEGLQQVVAKVCNMIEDSLEMHVIIHCTVKRMIMI